MSLASNSSYACGVQLLNIFDWVVRASQALIPNSNLAKRCTPMPLQTLSLHSELLMRAIVGQCHLTVCRENGNESPDCDLCLHQHLLLLVCGCHI